MKYNLWKTRLVPVLGVGALLSGQAHGGSAQTPAMAETLISEGSPTVPACVACHGLEGYGNSAAGFPALAGQSATYMLKQLEAFQAGTRQDPTMNVVAKGLSKAEGAALASWYEGQPHGPSSTVMPAGAESAAGETSDAESLGRALVLYGDWSRNLPACQQCHGPGGRGVGTAFPNLAGQHASYLSAQLKKWKSGQRTSDPGALMATVAKKMTDQEIEAVSMWLSSQQPVAR